MISPEEIRQNLYALNHTLEELGRYEGPAEEILRKSVASVVLNAINEQVGLLRSASVAKIPVVQPGSDSFLGTPGDPRFGKPYVGDPQPLPVGGSIPSPVQGDILSVDRPGDPIVGS